MTKGDKTKKKLYECAMQLFREKGYEHVTVSEIVKESGTAKGTFYIYFESKADVLIQMIREYDDYYDRIAGDFRKTDHASAKIRTIVKSAGSFTQDVIGHDLLRVLYTNQISGGKKELYSDRSLYRIISDLIREGKESGEFQITLPSDVLADNLIIWIRGMFFEWVMHEGKFNLKGRCEQLASFFCDAIR